MTRQTYTIMKLDKRRPKGVLLDVFATDLGGFDDLLADFGRSILAGSTCDIADLKTVLRLRHDGTWEAIRFYGTSENPEQDVVETILDDLVSDEEVQA